MTVMEDGKLLRASVMIEGDIRPITLRVSGPVPRLGKDC